MASNIPHDVSADPLLDVSADPTLDVSGDHLQNSKGLAPQGVARDLQILSDAATSFRGEETS